MVFNEHNRRLKLIFLGVILITIAFVVWFLYGHFRLDTLAIDPALQKTFDSIPTIKTYSQNVDTQIAFPNRELRITGTYVDDLAQNNFASYSTTTLLMNGEKLGHDFTHQNIVISADVYTKIETKDKLLVDSIKSSPTWRHFKADAIPEGFSGVAVPGPIQDNLQILGQAGKLLTLTKKWGTVKWGKDTLLRYTFKLSGHASESNGAVQAIISRIGQSGTVDVWIDPSTSVPHYLLFQNPPYYSTTTIQNINATAPILSPILPNS